MTKITPVIVAAVAAFVAVSTANARDPHEPKVVADPVYEWNIKNIPPGPKPSEAAAPAKKMGHHRHHHHMSKKS